MVEDRSMPPTSSPLVLLRGTLSGGAAIQAALSEALLDRVRTRFPPLAARLYVPGSTVAFGRMDTFQPGFASAAEAARAHGFEPVLRAPGGRAAAYHERSLVLELAAADEDPRAAIGARYAAMAELVVEALRGLGVPAATGELPGEYCPGRFSVLAGGVKLGGIAQRVVAGASLTGIAIVVEDGARVRSVLEDVSRALEYDFDPATAGAVADVTPGINVGDVEAALVEALAVRFAVVDIEPDAALLDAAAAREAEHKPVARSRTGGTER
jgi:lipoate-protein ligase A